MSQLHCRQDPIKLVAVTYCLTYALTHMGCKKRHRVHLRQVGNAVVWADEHVGSHGERQPQQILTNFVPHERRTEDLEVVELGSDEEETGIRTAEETGAASSQAEGQTGAATTASTEREEQLQLWRSRMAPRTRTWPHGSPAGAPSLEGP